jgi:hypothetical protein
VSNAAGGGLGRHSAVPLLLILGDVGGVGPRRLSRGVRQGAQPHVGESKDVLHGTGRLEDLLT